ncbi:MAG: NAD(P)H-dependent oxidoreductase [Candidatus Omnitrophota bacterium]
MKVLIVNYCPRGERSRTKVLSDHAAACLKARKAVLEVLDLASDIPDLLTPERVAAYYRRNYAGETLNGKDTALLAKMDRMTDQLVAADLVVVAYPMYNFSQPAIVKAWFDSVMQKGKTWDLTPTGYAGLLKGRKALIVTTSGGAYDGDMAFLEHSVSLSRVHFGFMGHETGSVIGAGINRYPEKEAEILAKAKTEIETVLSGFVL